MGSEAFASLLYLLGIYGEICYNITIMCQKRAFLLNNAV